MTALFHILYNL